RRSWLCGQSIANFVCRRYEISQAVHRSSRSTLRQGVTNISAVEARPCGTERKRAPSKSKQLAAGAWTFRNFLPVSTGEKLTRCFSALWLITSTTADRANETG